MEKENKKICIECGKDCGEDYKINLEGTKVGFCSDFCFECYKDKP